MAPIGGNNGRGGSPYVQINDDARKSSLAIRNSSGQAIDVTPVQVNNRQNSNRVNSGGASGVGQTSDVRDNSAVGVAVDPLGRKSPTPDKDTITINSKLVNNMIAKLREQKQLKALTSTGSYHEASESGPTRIVLAGKEWSWAETKPLVDAVMELTASGNYMMGAAQQPKAQVPTPTNTNTRGRRNFSMTPGSMVPITVR